MRLHLQPGLLVATILGSLATCAAAGAVSPARQVAAIMEAGQSQRSVHYVVSWTNAGKEWPDIVGDADVSMGAQYITWHKGGHVGHVTVIANATAAYVRGDAFALASYMLFPAAGASKYANRWIVIPKGASGYPTVSAGVRLKPAINALKPTGTLARVPNTVYGGQKVLGVQGKSSAGGEDIVG